jgi:hypothetical protein
MAGNTRRFQISTPRFEISSEIDRQYRHFYAMGTELTVQTLPTADPKSIDPMSHFIDTVNILECALYDRSDSDMVGLTICNDQNVADRAVGISFRR